MSDKLDRSIGYDGRRIPFEFTAFTLEFTLEGFHLISVNDGRCIPFEFTAFDC